MPNFEVINNSSEINLTNNWVPCAEFKNKNIFFDFNGNKISTDYAGHRYKIIEKRIRSFGILERLGRIILGSCLVGGSFFFALFSKSVRNLFRKTKASLYFATQFKITDEKKEEKNPFKKYLEKCNKNVVLSVDNVYESLESFGNYLENEVLKENPDSGYHLYDRYQILALKRGFWRLKLYLGFQSRTPYFNEQKPESALEVVAEYLRERFHDRIQKIEVKKDDLDIHWKT